MSERDEDGGQGVITLHPEAAPSGDPDALVVDLDGFEGPLDLMLELARNRKLDITRISILDLAGQYIAYIEQARNQRLRIAADYLVMAAWLAYLKSRLLLPEPDEDEEMSGEEMAAHLAFRLRRLEAMRDAAARLMARDRLGRDVFARGAPEPIEIKTRNAYLDTLYDLLRAYASERQRNAVHTITIRRRPVMSIKAARRRLERLLGVSADWIALDMFMAEFDAHPDIRRTSLASGFSAALEMVREGGAEMRQADIFGKLYVRNRDKDQ
ncbi:MAG: segregation/condensation protein A [Hyphomicrobiales bacterium]|nr:MAG: segregation/condensation protein A [Hyphomicrobiales bacterium]